MQIKILDLDFPNNEGYDLVYFLHLGQLIGRA